MTPYKAILGAQLDQLPDACRALHGGYGRWSGRITVTTARLLPLRWVARMFGLPGAVTDAPFELLTEPQANGALWSRLIGEDQMVSLQYATQNHLLAEKLGAAQVLSRLVLDDGGLHLETVHVRILGLPLPRLFWPRVRAREWQQDGVYRFDISVSLPLGGPCIVAYSGHLDTV